MVVTEKEQNVFIVRLTDQEYLKLQLMTQFSTWEPAMTIEKLLLAGSKLFFDLMDNVLVK